jgi:arylsulfatase A-like enzyme
VKRKKGSYSGRLALSALMLLGAGCAPDRDPNVILITLDTLRADHLGAYGYARPTSPSFDALADRSTLYTRAMASSPWTVPTHASLFTGKPVFQHGAHTVPIENVNLDGVRPLPERHLTLAEMFRDAGYATGGFIANDAYMGSRLRMDQGFETYHVERVYSDEMNRHVFQWLDENRERPFFLFINYMDTHRPYNTRWRPGLIERPFTRDNVELIKELYPRILPMKEPVPEDLVQELIDQYDTAVANVDEQLGLLLDRLSQLGIDDDTVLIVTSDHGEYFGEHFLLEHSKDVYQEALWVPLLVRGPRQAQGRIDDTLVVSYDIPWMVLQLLREDFAVNSRPEFPNAPGEHPVVAENYFSRAADLFHPVWGKRFERVRTVVYDWPLKYIHSSDDLHELYQLEEDPLESANLVDRQPDVTERLRSELARFIEERGVAAVQEQSIPLTEDERKRLEALGYL